MRGFRLNSGPGSVFIAFVFYLFACSDSVGPGEAKVIMDPLPSWNEGKVKAEIIHFVSVVCDSANSDYVPQEERIAVFDNDGTLWAEQPMYFQIFFAIDRLRDEIKNMNIDENSSLIHLIDGDMKAFSETGLKGILELVMTTHAGISTEEFELMVKDWMSRAKHPSKQVAFTDLVYQPMLELISYLKSNGFKCFIVSGGGMEFMRPWAEGIYGIPRDQIIGSYLKAAYEMDGDEPRIMGLPELEFVDDKEGKPIAINRFIGRKPVFCAGNSDGDLQMMRWTASNKLTSMMLYVHHTDSIREWSYDRNSDIGHFDKALDEAVLKSWTLVDMSEDWKTVFPSPAISGQHPE